MRRRVLLAVGAALGVSACTASPSPAPTPSPTESPTPTPTVSLPVDVETRVLADLAYDEPVYGSETAHLLDLYLPDGAPGPWPVLLFQAGSGFGSDDTKGSTTDLSGGTTAAFLAREWGPYGIAVAGVNVRKSSQATFPAQLDDVHAAIRYLRSRAGELGLDPARVATSGTSSGGWGAVMAAVTGSPDDGPDGGTAVTCVVDLYGPTDFLAMDSQRLPEGMVHDEPGSPESQLMGFPIQSDPEATRRANPVSYVTADSPPLWASHGTADPLVPYQQSELLFQAYADAGATATLTLVEGAGHTDEYLADGAPDRVVRTTRDGRTSESGDPEPRYDAVLAFLREHLGLG